MASSQLPLIDKEKSSLEDESLSKAHTSSIVIKGILKLLCFGRSIFAEWVVYVLVYSSIGAIVTFFVFLPLDLTCAFKDGDYERGFFIRLNVMLFVFPTGNFAFEAFPRIPLGTKVLLVGLWTLTVRPSLALAGWIVNKRLPAYTLPAEKYPPIRWSFEYLCCVANQHHLLVPDPEFYVRQAIRLISKRVSSDSYQLGSMSLDEHDQLRTFSHIYWTVMDQYWEEGWPKLPIPAFKYGEVAHLICAERILSQVDRGLPSSRSLGMQARWEYPFFWRMYVFVLGYWMLRVHGEISALIWPYCEDGTSCAEEWYEKYAVLTPPV
ncbi:hypothetical protein CGCSCA1_v007308 [Colletotrichum siamense]|nr:hypothetical protein CGCSCA1_v007308 [Colletotrichum siamense]